MQENRQNAQQPLGQHVASIRGVDLSIDRERQRSAEATHTDSGRRALLVILEAPRTQAGLEICLIARVDVWGVFVCTAREQISIPMRDVEQEGQQTAAQSITPPIVPRRMIPTNVPCSPKRGTRKNPAASAPAMAPSVLAT